MKLALYTDSIARRPLPDVLDIAREAGIEAVELATGGQSSAPHLDLGLLLAENDARQRLLDELRTRDLMLSALNCSAWPLHPVHGKESERVIEGTLALAELLGVDKVVTMSGTPGDVPESTTFSWVWYPWPPDQVELLERQWESALAYWSRTVELAWRHGVRKLAFELHPLHLVYNVPTLERLRAELGPVVGANVDPSHLVWQRMDPAAVVRALGPAVHHVHLKDTRFADPELRLAGILDSHPFADPHKRAWTFCTVGRGLVDWAGFLESLREVGYTGDLSIENEDPFVDDVEGVLAAADSIRPLLEAHASP